MRDGESSGVTTESAKIGERRRDRRLPIQLPLTYRRQGSGRGKPFGTVTLNVSTGGVYFMTTADDMRAGDMLDLEFGVPTDDDRFPPDGKIATVGRVVRTERISARAGDREPSFARFGVAAQFEQGLKLAF